MIIALAMGLPASGRRDIQGRFSFPFISPPDDIENTSDGCHESNRTCHDRAVLGNVDHSAGISGELAIKSSHPSRPSRAVHQCLEPQRNSAHYTHRGID
jgi:hypothetical protein